MTRKEVRVLLLDMRRHIEDGREEAKACYEGEFLRGMLFAIDGFEKLLNTEIKKLDEDMKKWTSRYDDMDDKEKIRMLEYGLETRPNPNTLIIVSVTMAATTALVMLLEKITRLFQ